ncbi:efflux RND transporter periplasmic adaptor subunit [Flavobacterium sp. NRK F7]|uniref:efflux RND transporter periplasmic adaptor subunit n=1 Tax=Flavobacterium sp. NRK F7 TaxID=2954930 RepID=UPI002091A67B|nr:efflux RND transporter periplasmic adaptor subunit [Flavobacterium sp. NRK F7]MCO6162971.1 efflux RND transporter periplasmic adaptor subunit [Flavobacterium sp. NRK F7]
MKKVLIFMSICTLLLNTSCKKEVEKKEENTHFLVTNPIKKDTLITKDYVSQIQSSRHIELRAQERGYLQKIFIDEGQFVKQGQLLFQIMPKLYEAEMEKARAEASFAEIEYKNTKRLADSDVVAPNELAMAKAKLDKANAELALAQVHLQFTQIRAPFDGIVDKFHVRLGSLVEEGDLLTNLSDNSKMWVYYNVPEAEYLDFKAEQKSDVKPTVNLLMANNKYFEYPGIVETIEADFNNETGNISFRATFPNPKSLLRHGETGNIHVTLPYKNAMLIPQKATFEVLDKKYVYVIDKDNKVVSREIKLAAELPHLFIVSEGLSEDDKILLEGLRLVKENEKIEYKLEKPETVLAHLELYAE